MSSFVPVRACAPLGFVLSWVFVALLMAAPSRAKASDGYEVGFAVAGVMVPALALDVTFIVASATGLTYEDEGWAIAQTIWAVASMAACGVGVALVAQEPGYEGLAGGLALLGGAQAVYLGFALHALGRSEWATRVDTDGSDAGGFLSGLSFGAAPLPGGVMVSLGWRG